MFGMLFAPLWDNGTKSCFAPGFRDLVPFLGSVAIHSCGSSFNGTEIYQNVSKYIKMYQNVSKCINMYRNVSKCISLPPIFGPVTEKLEVLHAAVPTPFQQSGACGKNSNEETYKAFQTITKHCKQGNHHGNLLASF